MTSDPETLGLVGYALDGARHLSASFPALVFTSGRRTANEQARAMAQNIAQSGSRTWIADTYKASPISLACQRWVNGNPKATTAAQLEAGLLAVFATIDEVALETLSQHMTGRAFDVQPFCVPLSPL